MLWLANNIGTIFSFLWEKLADPKVLRASVIISLFLCAFNILALYRIYQFDSVLFIREIELTESSTPTGNTLLRDGKALVTSFELCKVSKEYFIVEFEPQTEHACRVIAKLYDLYLEDSTTNKVHTTDQPFNKTEIQTLSNEVIVQELKEGGAK